MRSWRPVLLVVAAALAFLALQTDSRPISAGVTGPLDYVPGEVIVTVRQDVPETAAAGFIEGAEPAAIDESLDAVRVELPPDVGVAEAVAAYEGLPWVESVEPNYRIFADVVPNDSLYPTYQSWYYNLMNAPAAWDISTGSASVVVAVLDTGVDSVHPDLDSKLDPGTAFISSPTNSGDGPGFVNCPNPHPSGNYQDDNIDGHGTFVSGVVGAETNNAQGVAGTAWNVRIEPIKILDCNGVGSYWDLKQGIDYAANPAQGNADVINMSLAGPKLSPFPCGTTLHNSITQAVNNSVVLIAAAGNKGGAVQCPAAHPDVIAVGASGAPPNTSSRASFSNYGPEIDVVAPGESICSTFPGNSYACGGGTSFASPLVAGLAALILSEHPTFTPKDVRAVLLASAVNLPSGSTPGWDGCGRIDMLAALQMSQPPQFDDVIGVYDNGGAKMSMWAFEGDGVEQCQLTETYTSCSGCWSLSQSRMLPADVDADGDTDMVGIYNYGDGLIRMWTFFSDGNSFTSVVKSFEGCSGCWNLNSSQMLAADVNGDGKDDIVGVYGYAGGLIRMWKFLSNGSVFSPVAQNAYEGCSGCWNLDQSRMFTADVTGDNKDDIVGAYDYGNGVMKMWTFISNGTSFATVKLASGGCTGCWYLNRSQMLAADINGDNKDDVVGAYDYGNGVMKMWTFKSNGMTFGSAKLASSGCTGCWDLSRSQMVRADVNGDGKNDVVGAYDYGGGLLRMWTFVSNGTVFSSVYKSYEGCSGCWYLPNSLMLPLDD